MRLRGGSADAVAADDVERILAELGLDEKLRLLSGDLPVRDVFRMGRRYNALPYEAAAAPRLGVGGIRFADGPRGVVLGRSTAFPVAMARGATFDPELEERIGDALGVEARAQGANLFAGVCVNLLRHPAWGRAQETYGEDPHLLGEMGAALVRGSQRHVMACVKHFACNSIENARFWVDVRIDEADLRDVYLPHFRRCVDAGVAAVMSAYNKVNGAWCGHSRHLLTDVLRREWGFTGFVMSDFVLGVRGPDAVAAGMDLEMPSRIRFRGLGRALARGRIAAADIDAAVRRLVGTQRAFAARGEPERYRRDAVASPAHRALAREAAERSIVLLTNAPPVGDGRALLPFDLASVRRIAVVGRLAALPNTGDHGSSRVRPPEVATPLAGLLAAAPARGAVVVDAASDDAARGAAAARAADVAVVVVGCTFRDEGEYLSCLGGGDRTALRLRPAHERLIEAVAAANPRTVVVLMGGAAIVTEAWRGAVPSMLMAWYPGMEGGHALAALLLGDATPSGRLPCTWPRSAAQLPPFARRARIARYDSLHGYRLMQAERRAPAFWFGHGLSYTRFTYGAPRLEGDALVLTITNAGERAGAEVVQLYVDLALGTDPRPLGTLRDFRRVPLAASESRELRFALEPAWRRVHVGPSADPAGWRTIAR
ncbi:MAG: glycoside hydrolase family 3 C-terminal domain-containing protein [Deltaproteobacteria bacterium]|nr:glycoside hydrolase family 3 C-terminal domain-containing protein [Deltaproteobacteria bacterium]